MESFYLQFDSEASCLVKAKKKHRVKRVASAYEKEFLPLAIEFYTHHVQSSDLVLLNSLLSFSNFGPLTGDANASALNLSNRIRAAAENNNDADSNNISESIFQAKNKERKESMLILNYFVNLKRRYGNLKVEVGSDFNLQKYDVQERVAYYEHEQMRLRNSE